jgi:hypothetical protein
MLIDAMDVLGWMPTWHSTQNDCVKSIFITLIESWQQNFLVA